MSDEAAVVDGQQEAPVEKPKTAHVITTLDAFAYRLSAPNPRNPNDKDANFRIGYTGYEHPRIHINTNVTTDNKEGYLGLRIDEDILRLMITYLKKAATEGGKFEIANKGHYDKDGNKHDEPIDTSKLIIFRGSEDGIVYLMGVAEGTTPVKFPLQYNLKYHSITENGVVLTPAQSSQVYALNFAEGIKDLIPIVHDQISRTKGIQTKTPSRADDTNGAPDLPPDQGQPNNYGGGNRQGGGNYNRGGGNYQNRGGGNYQQRGGGHYQNRGGGNNNYQRNNNYQNNNQQSQSAGFDPMADSGGANTASFDPIADLKF